MCANDAEQLPLVVGRLQFGATRGPRTWQTDRDGPWVPAYWVEIQGGLDDGEVVLIPDKARIARGLSAGDLCAIEYDVEGARCIALEENEYASAEAAVKPGFASKRLPQVALQTGGCVPQRSLSALRLP